MVTCSQHTLDATQISLSPRIQQANPGIYGSYTLAKVIVKAPLQELYGI